MVKHIDFQATIRVTCDHALVVWRDRRSRHTAARGDRTDHLIIVIEQTDFGWLSDDESARYRGESHHIIESIQFHWLLSPSLRVQLTVLR